MADNDSPPDRTVIAAVPREPTQAPATPQPAAGNHMLSIGAVISNTYRIDAFIARGGIGEVYRAFNLAADRVAAIKLIRPEFTADPTVVELFKREADILRRLRHDALVGYDGIFYDDAGRLCLAMDYVDGPSLGKLLQDGPLPPADVRRLRERVAAGLQAAHEERVFHRDISPDNIILPDGDIGRAKVIDFGIARDIDPSRKTVLGGTFAGKYSYASPEQLGMHGGEVGAPSDIYSLGLVLAEAASGEAIDMGMSPISVVEARRAVPDLSRVPPELRDEIAAMLQPDPAHRPQSMRALGGAAPPAAPPAAKVASAASAGAAKPPRRGLVAAAAAVAVIAAGGVAAYLLLPGDRPAGPAPTSQTAAVTPAPLPPPEPPRPVGAPPSSEPAAVAPPAALPPAALPPATLPSAVTAPLPPPVTATPLPPPAPPAAAPPRPAPVARSEPPAAPAPAPMPAIVPPPAASVPPVAALPPPIVTPPPVAPPPERPAARPSPPPAIAAVPPATVSMPPPETRPQPSLDEVRAALGGYDCSTVVASADRAIAVRGYVSTRADLAKLRQRLSGMGLAEDAFAGVAVRTRPLCGLLQAVPMNPDTRPDLRVAGTRLPRLAVDKDSRVYLKDDYLVIQATQSQAFDGHLFVGFFDVNGDFLPLLPSSDHPSTQVARGRVLTLGAGKERYRIDSPWGVSILFAVASPQPVVSRESQSATRIDAFIAGLRRDLSRLPPAEVEAVTLNYLDIEARER